MLMRIGSPLSSSFTHSTVSADVMSRFVPACPFPYLSTQTLVTDAELVKKFKAGLCISLTKES